MFPGMPVQANKQERKLIKIFKSFDANTKETLIAFAEFLQNRAASTDVTDDYKKEESQVVSQPLDIPRPEVESVIQAIKRLTATYPMVNKEDILHPISGLMTSHIMQGKKAAEVIDKLENLFENEYKKTNNKDSK